MVLTVKNIDANIIKASLFNFVIYTHHPGRAQYYRELIDSVVEKFPCRVILVLGGEEEVFETEDSLKESGSIACEFTEIKAGGNHLIQVPYYILPHLEPDLPIYLLWGQDPTEKSEILDKLLGYADRLIFDAESAQNLAAFSKRLLEKKKHIHCEILDMSWARSGGWREVIARSLDSPAKLEVLTKARKVEIEYSNYTQADYLQAWIASRLKWKFEKGDGNTIHYKGKEVKLLYKESNVAVLSFFAETGDGREIRITRPGSAYKQATVHFSTQEECQVPFTVPFQTHSRGLSFVRELLYSSQSSDYIEMLKMVKEK